MPTCNAVRGSSCANDRYRLLTMRWRAFDRRAGNTPSSSSAGTDNVTRVTCSCKWKEASGREQHACTLAHADWRTYHRDAEPNPGPSARTVPKLLESWQRQGPKASVEAAVATLPGLQSDGRTATTSPSPTRRGTLRRTGHYPHAPCHWRCDGAASVYSVVRRASTFAVMLWTVTRLP